MPVFRFRPQTSDRFRLLLITVIKYRIDHRFAHRCSPGIVAWLLANLRKPGANPMGVTVHCHTRSSSSVGRIHLTGRNSAKRRYRATDDGRGLPDPYRALFWSFYLGWMTSPWSHGVILLAEPLHQQMAGNPDVGERAGIR